MNIRNKLFTQSRIKSDSLPGLAEALDKAFRLKPGEKIRIKDEPVRYHTIRDTVRENPIFLAYERRQAHFRALEAQEAAERQRLAADAYQRQYGPNLFGPR